MKKLFFLTALLCASLMGWATQYCDEPLTLNGGAEIQLSCIKVSDGNYQIVIKGTNLNGLGGSFYNPGAVDLRSKVTTSTATLIVCDIEAESAPTLYTPLYVMCPGEQNIGWPNDVEWGNCGGGESKTPSELSINATEVTLDATIPETFLIEANTAEGYDGTVTYTSDKADVASVSASGSVTAVGRGTATITVTAPETDNYAKSTKKLTVTVTGPINWDAISWLGGSDDKYKMVVDPSGPNIVNVQTRDDKKAIYVTFGSADFGDCSLNAVDYTTDGAGRWYFLSAFPGKEHTFTQVCQNKTYTFDLYYEDGKDVWEIYDTNFALASNGATVVASHTQGDNNIASKAIDGNNGTSWESTHGVDEVTLTIDMGKLRIFNTIQLLWQDAYGKHFTIDVSNDNSEWRTIKTVDETLSGFPHEQTLELASNDTARYIRFNGIERGTQWGYNLYEFRVYLPGVSVLTSINLTSASPLAKIGEDVELTVQPKDQNGKPMDVEVEYEITPAAAGSVVAGKFMPAQTGAASIVAYNGEVRSNAITVYGVVSDNLAFSTNIDTDNKVISQSDFSPKGTNAFFAVDGNDGSVYQGSPTDGTAADEASRTFDAWFIVDLGANYSIDLITIHFEGACSQAYHVDFSEDNTNWQVGYNYAGSSGINNHTDYLVSLENNTKVRYVRFWSTKAATEWGMKMYEFQVFGQPWSAPTAISNAEAEVKAVKVIENGQLVIIKNGVKYNVAGQQVK